METVAHPDLQPRKKRHYRSADERRRIVEETLVPGASVAAVARAHGINDNQVFAWRKLYRTGLLGSISSTSASEANMSSVRLLPVAVTDCAKDKKPSSVAVSAQSGAHCEAVVAQGSIELTLSSAQVRIMGQVDAAVLHVVLECLRA
jgi:transposase